MRQTNLTINYTDATTGKKSSDKISYVNPNITDQQALTLSQAFANLSQNTYVSTDKTDTYNINTEQKTVRDPQWQVYLINGGSTERTTNTTISVPVNQVRWSNNAFQFALFPRAGVNDPARPILSNVQTTGTSVNPNIVTNYLEVNSYVYQIALGENEPQTITFTLSFIETSTHQAFSKNYTIIITNSEEG